MTIRTGRGIRPPRSETFRLRRLIAATATTVLLAGAAGGCSTPSASGPAGGPNSAVSTAPTSGSASASQAPSASAAPSTSAGKPSATSGSSRRAGGKPAPTKGSSPASGGKGGQPSAHPAAAKTTPTRGSIRQTVKSRSVKTAKPVVIGAPKKSGHKNSTQKKSAEKKSESSSSFGDQITAKLTGIRHGYVRAKIPGQLPGPSVIFDLTISNGSGAAVDLNPLVVNLTDASGSPAEQITSVTPARPMPDLLQPGKSATGTFIFVVPKDQRNPVTVDVTISANLKVVTFRGDAR